VRKKLLVTRKALIELPETPGCGGFHPPPRFVAERASTLSVLHPRIRCLVSKYSNSSNKRNGNQ
jgi:hypothetical protein